MCEIIIEDKYYTLFIYVELEIGDWLVELS